MTCWVYMVRCRDGSLYTGWTNDLAKRLAAHNNGAGAKYTRGRGPVHLAWACPCETKQEALSLEVATKRLTKPQKEVLCTGWVLPQGLAGKPIQRGYLKEY